MVKIVMLVLQTLDTQEDGLMENDKEDIRERLKKPFLTTEQKLDIIRDCNTRKCEEEWNNLLAELSSLARQRNV